MRLVELDKRKFLLGLNWFRTESEKPSKEEIADFTSDTDARSGAIVASKEAGHAAVGVLDDGLVDGEKISPLKTYYSLAGTVAKTFDNAIIVDSLDNESWWFCAVLNGLVLSGTDKIFNDKDDLLDAIEEVISEGVMDDCDNKTLVYTPDFVARAVGEDFNLVESSVLAERFDPKALVRIQTIKGISPALMIGGVTLAGVFSLALMLISLTSKDDVPLPIAPPEPTVDVNALLDEKLNEETNRFVASMLGDLSVEWVDHAIDLAESIPSDVAGFRLTELTCNAQAGCGLRFDTTQLSSPDKLRAYLDRLDPDGDFKMDLAASVVTKNIKLTTGTRALLAYEGIPSLKPAIETLIGRAYDLKASYRADWVMGEPQTQKVTAHPPPGLLGAPKSRLFYVADYEIQGQGTTPIYSIAQLFDLANSSIYELNMKLEAGRRVSWRLKGRVLAKDNTLTTNDLNGGVAHANH